MNTLKIFLLLLISMVLIPGLEGWTLATLWAWFVVPALGLPQLTIPTAVGLMVMLILVRTEIKAPPVGSAATAPKRPTTKAAYLLKELPTSIGYSVGKCASVLITGWIVTLFM